MVPRTLTSTFGPRAFSTSGPAAWNVLSSELRDPSISLDCFRHSLKTYLYKALGLVLRWGLGNSQRVGQAYGIKQLNCHRNPLVQKSGFRRIGCAKRCSPANICQKKVVPHPLEDPASRQPLEKNTWLDERLLYLADFLSDAAVAALPAMYRTL